ncbi:MAG: hypothetical protein ABIJ35_13075 [Acidobacteriota bacterium]
METIIMGEKIDKAGMSLINLCLRGLIIVFLLVFGTIFFIRARNMATIRSTAADMIRYSTAITDYITDHGVAPTNPFGPIHHKKPFIRELLPYLGMARCMDWWRYPFRIWTGAGNRIYGLSTTRDNDFIIASFGKKGLIDGWKYDPDDPARGGFPLISTSDFERDIVLMNGEWVRAPFFILDKNRSSGQAKNIGHKDGDEDGSAR